MDKPLNSLKVLIDQNEIEERVKALGDQINTDYANKSLTVIIISNGAIIFAADLIRKISIPLQFDTLSISSYVGTRSSGTVTFNNSLKMDIMNRDILIIDDIIDTGKTLREVHQYLMKFNPNSIKSCVLLEKLQSSNNTYSPNYIGFRIDDYFVVGYGLDYNERYRNLPFIAIL